jgi:hypothetical protein
VILSARKEAVYFRELAGKATDSPVLRDSYLGLALQYERLAQFLESANPPALNQASPTVANARPVGAKGDDFHEDHGISARCYPRCHVKRQGTGTPHRHPIGTPFRRWFRLVPVANRRGPRGA